MGLRKTARFPAGFVQSFAGTVAPGGWLACNGATVSRTAYAALFAAIGTTYGAGDGATTFALPDLRDDFVRGASASRPVGTRAGDTIRAHSHEQRSYGDNGLTTGSAGQAAGIVFTNGEIAAPGLPLTTGNAGGAETAPRHVAMLACIKF